MAVQMKRATVTVELCTDADLLGRHEQLTATLAQNARRGIQDDRLTGDPVAREIVEVEKQMQESMLVFTLRAHPRKEWSALKAVHPPREDDETDANIGVNVSTFIDAAMPGAIQSVVQKSTGEPVEWSEGDWLDLADEMSLGQWEHFAGKLLALNNSNVGVPFSLAASKQTQTSGEN